MTSFKEFALLESLLNVMLVHIFKHPKKDIPCTSLHSCNFLQYNLKGFFRNFLPIDQKDRNSSTYLGQHYYSFQLANKALGDHKGQDLNHKCNCIFPNIRFIVYFKVAIRIH